MRDDTNTADEQKQRDETTATETEAEADATTTRRAGYVSPDEAERNPEALDHAEAAYRANITHGRSSGGRRF